MAKSASGYILLHRKIMDWEWYGNHNTSRVFIHLLITANYKDEEWRGRIIRRGERVITTGGLAEEIGLSTRQLRTALANLVKSDDLILTPTNKYTVATLVNYERYQISDKQNVTQTTRKTTRTSTSKNTQSKQGKGVVRTVASDKQNDTQNDTHFDKQSDKQNMTQHINNLKNKEVNNYNTPKRARAREDYANLENQISDIESPVGNPLEVIRMNVDEHGDEIPVTRCDNWMTKLISFCYLRSIEPSADLKAAMRQYLLAGNDYTVLKNVILQSSGYASGIMDFCRRHQ